MQNIHVYCINLKKRPDRWQRFVNQPAIKEIMKVAKFERFEGIDGSTLDIKNDDRISVRTKRNIMLHRRRDHEDLDTAGGIGCYLSHAAVWKKFMETGDEYCVIFEDDALIPDNFIALFEAGMKSMELNVSPPPDLWNMSSSHAESLKFALGIPNTMYTNGWAYDDVMPFTGYTLFKRGVKTLLDNAFPIDGHVDLFINRLAQIGAFHSVSYRGLSLRQATVQRGDTNIQAGGCELCNVPYNPKQSGFVIMRKQ
jgi:GR25 family glycosyltransferase involved in LPS biosynthesis